MKTLYSQLQNSGYDFYLLVVDKFLDISLPQLSNFHTIFQENLKVKNSGYLLSQKNIQDKIRLSKNPVIIPFKPSAKIELLCQKNHWLLAANPSKINRLLEDKIKFFELCQKNNLPLIPAFIAEFTKENFLIAQNKFGQNFVIQTHFGWAGNSTYSFINYTEALKFIPKNTVCKFSPFFDGYSLLNNCCLTQYGLIQSPPALQYTGLKELTNNPFSTVGRQWPSLAPIEIQKKIKDITADFSEKILKPLNYRGFFGLDFIIHHNQVYLLECNPRLTASFAFYTHLELKQKITPIFFFHLAEFINLNYQFNIQKEQSRFYNSQIVGSEITQKNSFGTTIKKYNTFKILSPQKQPIIINPQTINKFLK